MPHSGKLSLRVAPDLSSSPFSPRSDLQSAPLLPEWVIWDGTGNTPVLLLTAVMKTLSIYRGGHDPIISREPGFKARPSMVLPWGISMVRRQDMGAVHQTGLGPPHKLASICGPA